MDVPRQFPWLAPLAGGEPVSQPLAGQVALVTGAGTGIGAAAARALAHAGAGVGLLGRRPQPLEQVAAEIVQAGGQGWALPADVTNLAAVEAAVARCQALGAGRLDLLVNNAGINTKYRSLDNISAADWSRVVDINLNGAYWCVRAVLPVMRQQGSGLIVNVSSGAGLSSIARVRSGLQRHQDRAGLAQRLDQSRGAAKRHSCLRGLPPARWIPR